MESGFDFVIDREKQETLYYNADDSQVTDLLMKITLRFDKVFSMTDREFHALCRLRNLINSENKDPANIRNQVFKIANELEIKLPSYIF